MYRLSGILGGTFDPVHHAHLRLALEAREQAGLDEIRLIPAARPPHRQPPVASPEQRLAMLQAALADTPGLLADGRELARPGASYTVDTLLELQAPDTALCLLVGMDAFAGLPSWNRWTRLIELAHLLVVKRPGAELQGEMREYLQQHQAADAAELRHCRAGLILPLDLPPLDISASYIRSLIAQGRDPRYLLPDAVLRLIRAGGFYRN
jgi:nicotinate-nucleotide adenylyltransferase